MAHTLEHGLKPVYLLKKPYLTTHFKKELILSTSGAEQKPADAESAQVRRMNNSANNIKLTACLEVVSVNRYVCNYAAKDKCQDD